MNRLLWLLRLPLFLAGMLLLLVADRYLSAETYHTALRVAAFVLAGLGFASSALLAAGAKGRGLDGEAKGWRLTLAWQGSVIVGMLVYLGYCKTVGDGATPETFSAKAQLALWLLLIGLGSITGLGIEWSMLDNGRGSTAEPQRVTRATVSWLSVGLLLAFLVTLNYAGDKRDVSRDWSYLKVRTPTEPTLKMAAALSEPLTVALFYPPGNEVRTLIGDYFEALSQGSQQVKVESYDKDMNPTKAEAFKVSRNGQIVLDMKGKMTRIDTGTTLAKARKTLKQLDGEFQKAFLEATASRRTLYFTRGHGEASWVGAAGDNPLKSLRALEGYLRQQNYSTRLFGIAEGSASAVPDDAAAVVIAGPTEPFQTEEIDTLKSYVDGGGNLLVFLDLEKSDSETAMGDDKGQPLIELLAGMGIRFNATPLGNEKNHVAMTRTPADNWFIFTNIFTSHDSVVSLSRHDERVALLVYRGGYFSVTPELGRWKAFETVRTLSDSFADTNRNFKFDTGEKKDAFVLGAAAELKDQKNEGDKNNPKHGRVVAFADATVIADVLTTQNPGNALYFADSLKWVVGQSELAGEVALEEDVKIRHTRKEDIAWFYGTVFAVPGIVLGAGFFATRRRRRSEEGGGHAA